MLLILTFYLKILKGHLWSRRREVVKLCAGECVQLMQRITNVFLLDDWQRRRRNRGAGGLSPSLFCLRGAQYDRGPHF